MNSSLLTLKQLLPPGKTGTTDRRNVAGRKNLYLLPFLFLLAALLHFPAFAQLTPQYYKGGGTGGNLFPFGTNLVKRSQHLYLPGDLPGAIAGNITRIYVKASGAAAAGTYSDFRLSLKQTTATAFPGTAGDQFFTSVIPVVTATSFTLPAQTADAWVPIDLQTPFLFNPLQTLVVEIEMSAGTGGFGVRTTTSPAAPNHKRLTANSLSATTGNSSTLWTDFGIDVGPSSACSGAPNAGTALSSVSTICPNANFNLTLTGATFATGITYQWQSSPDNVNWTDIAGATASSLTRTQNATTFYRAVLFCSGVRSNSASVQVTTNAIPASGTFTINRNIPASASNFTSFASAINTFACGGPNGPIVLNIVAGSGPYNEHVVIPNMPNMTATNSITINGNGNTLIGATGSGDVLKLEGADYVRVNNLKIETNPTATTGAAVSLVNGADNNIFTNNQITHSTTTTVTSSYALYVYNGCSNNSFQNNTLTGGNYSIYNSGTAVVANAGNQFTGNILKDMNNYAIHISYTTGTLIQNNDISRPTRVNAGLLYGVSIFTGSTTVTVDRNRIHNTHDAATVLNGYVYGVSTNSPGTAGAENIIKNNAMYNLNNTLGHVYGFNNSGGNNTYYFHNTVSADYPTATYGLSRGIYFLTAATNVKFMNNNIKLSSPATTKHAIYVGNATMTLQSNNNNLYVDTTGNVGYYSGDKATMASWRSANSNAYDQASVSVDPQFLTAATGDLRPSVVALDNLGTAVTPPVTDDITGAPRSATTPDIGAFEFTINPNDVGIVKVYGPGMTGCGLSATETVKVTIKNFGSSIQTSIPVRFKVNGTLSPTENWTGSLAPSDTVTYTFLAKANLSTSMGYSVVGESLLTSDGSAANNTDTLTVANSLIPGLPITFDFETVATGLSRFQKVIRSKSNLVEHVDASSPLGATSAKGIIMEGVDHPNWLTPSGVTDPWTNNPDNFAAAYFCISPAGGLATDSLILTFDLKQLFKTANSNTNFRVTINGTQVGPTYRPPFTGTPLVWQKVKVNLTSYKNDPTVQIGLESNVKEAYANGTGTANLIDNIEIKRVAGVVSGVKENALLQNVAVYPNPSSGLFNLNLPQGETCGLTVTDLTGKVLKKQTASGNWQLNLEGTAKGIYMLQVSSENGSAVRKLIVE